IASVRNPSTATELHQLQESGLPISIQTPDICEADNAREVMTRVLDGAGVDALANTADATLYASVEATSRDQMRDMMITMLLDDDRLIQLALPHMGDRRAGRIINISSLSGIVPLPYLGAYGATKHALDAVSLSLAAEVRPFGVYVTIVSPSGFRTSITDKLWPAGIAVDEPAYETGTKIITQKMAGRLNNDPAPVFQAIADLLQTPNPPLRHLIGENAQKLSEMR